MITFDFKNRISTACSAYHKEPMLLCVTIIFIIFQTLGTRINVTLYSPPLPEFDYSMVVIFLIALLTVMLGGYWSGVSEL